MDRINTAIIKFQNRKQEGQGMVEYALTLGIIAIGSIVALNLLSDDINNLLGRVGTAVSGANFS